MAMRWKLGDWEMAMKWKLGDLEIGSSPIMKWKPKTLMHLAS